MGLEVVVGFLIAWMSRKARQMGSKIDKTVDNVLDSRLDQLGVLVEERLGHDPAFVALKEAGTEASDRTKTRVLLALEDVMENDKTFAAAVHGAAQRVQSATVEGGPVNSGISVSGGVNASGSGIAIGGIAGGDVSVSDRATNPTMPDRA